MRSGALTAANVVNESLRLLPPPHSAVRFATEGLEVGGDQIQKNSVVHLLIAAANRDPACFETSASWLPGRTAVPLNTFGGGPHACVGTQLVRSESGYLLDQVLARFRRVEVVPPTEFRSAPFQQPREITVVVSRQRRRTKSSSCRSAPGVLLDGLRLLHPGCLRHHWTEAR